MCLVSWKSTPSSVTDVRAICWWQVSNTIPVHEIVAYNVWPLFQATPITLSRLIRVLPGKTAILLLLVHCAGASDCLERFASEMRRWSHLFRLSLHLHPSWQQSTKWPITCLRWVWRSARNSFTAFAKKINPRYALCNLLFISVVQLQHKLLGWAVGYYCVGLYQIINQLVSNQYSRYMVSKLRCLLTMWNCTTYHKWCGCLQAWICLN